MRILIWQIVHIYIFLYVIATTRKRLCFIQTVKKGELLEEVKVEKERGKRGLRRKEMGEMPSCLPLYLLLCLDLPLYFCIVSPLSLCIIPVSHLLVYYIYTNQIKGNLRQFPSFGRSLPCMLTIISRFNIL